MFKKKTINIECKQFMKTKVVQKWVFLSFRKQTEITKNRKKQFLDGPDLHHDFFYEFVRQA